MMKIVNLSNIYYVLNLLIFPPMSIFCLYYRVYFISPPLFSLLPIPPILPLLNITNPNITHIFKASFFSKLKNSLII